MARRLRIHIPGGYYHVTLRGNHQQPIFRDAADRALLNAIVARALQTNAARTHAYCWMTNHLHFFVEVSEIPLGVLMRDIASNYARAFQAKLSTSGHLFERRYDARLVDIDAYLFALLRYIHLNPVTGGLVRDVASYRWSSHRAYAGLAAGDSWLVTDFCLAMFAPERRAAQAAYRRAVAEGELLSISRQPAAVQARAWIARQATDRGVASLSEVARALGRDRATLRYAMRINRS